MLRDAWAAGRDLGALAQRLGRSPDALRLHAEALGLHRPQRRRRWSPAEDATLRDGYAQDHSCRQIAAALPGRSPTTVAARARKLGLSTYARAWTAGEDARLRALAEQRPAAEIARALGRTPEAVRRRARSLALSALPRPAAPRAGANWSSDEDALLRLHAGLNRAALAALLDRSDQAVVTRLRRLGLRNARERSPHHSAATTRGLTPGEWRLLQRELRQARRPSLLALGRRLGRSPRSCASFLEERSPTDPQPIRLAAR